MRALYAGMLASSFSLASMPGLARSVGAISSAVGWGRNAVSQRDVER
jgi:hypothetical protein